MDDLTATEVGLGQWSQDNRRQIIENRLRREILQIMAEIITEQMKIIDEEFNDFPSLNEQGKAGKEWTPQDTNDSIKDQ